MVKMHVRLYACCMQYKKEKNTHIHFKAATANVETFLAIGRNKKKRGGINKGEKW